MTQFAIFGGTFNPVHCGHLRIAEAALSQVPLERVIWAPTYLPPQLKAARPLDFHCRTDMIERAIAAHPRFELLSFKPAQPGKSFAIDTLFQAQAVYPQVERWYWIIGLDSFQSLPRWRQRQNLASRCVWLVAPRGVSDEEVIEPAARPFHAQTEGAAPARPLQLQQCQQVEQLMANQDIAIEWQLLQMPLANVSSSLVRRYCQEGRSIQGLVPEPVRLYILQHQLYSQPPTGKSDELHLL